MKAKISLAVALVTFFSGCTSVPMANKDVSDQAKQFSATSEGKVGLYVFRDSALGAALKKDVWVDGKCLGETAPNIFFYEELEDKPQHLISTESEFSPNEMTLKTEAGNNYFVRQYIKLGVFVGGAGLESVSEDEGKRIVAKLKMALKGNCSK